MKYSAVAIIFTVVSAGALAAPQLKIDRITEIRDCGGPNALGSITGTIYTDPIKVPGEASANVTLFFKAPTPELVNMRKTLTRLNDNYTVPCLSDNFTGSCTVNFCQTIIDQPQLVCPLLPTELTCACPFAAGTYVQEDAILSFGNVWNEIQGGVTGRYTSRIEIIALGVAFGCGELDYNIVSA